MENEDKTINKWSWISLGSAIFAYLALFYGSIYISMIFCAASIGFAIGAIRYTNKFKRFFSVKGIHIAISSIVLSAILLIIFAIILLVSSQVREYENEKQNIPLITTAQEAVKYAYDEFNYSYYSYHYTAPNTASPIVIELNKESLEQIITSKRYNTSYYNTQKGYSVRWETDKGQLKETCSIIFTQKREIVEEINCMLS